jgi:hypothetical protein
MRFNLPAHVELTCPHCRLAFSLRSRLLHQRLQLMCPFCGHEFEVYSALPSQLRRKVYYTLRDEMEHRVYTKHRRVKPDYFDEWSASAGAGELDQNNES